MELCSKTFIQQPMKYMVTPSETNDYVIEFDGIEKNPTAAAIITI